MSILLAQFLWNKRDKEGKTFWSPLQLPFTRDTKFLWFLNKSWEMPIVNYLLVGNCDAGIWFITVKINLTFKKGQRERLARGIWSSPIHCSIQEQLSIAIKEHCSVSLVCVAFVLQCCPWCSAVGFCWCHSVQGVTSSDPWLPV